MIAMKRRKKTIRPVADSRSYLLSGSRDCLRGDVAVFDGSEIPQGGKVEVDQFQLVRLGKISQGFTGQRVQAGPRRSLKVTEQDFFP